MIAETKEKEPASVGADASSEVRNSPNISTSNDTTEPPKSQAPALSAITMLAMLESMLENAYGREAEPIYIRADKQSGKYCFALEGREYEFSFGERQEVPAYGNDKH